MKDFQTVRKHVRELIEQYFLEQGVEVSLADETVFDGFKKLLSTYYTEEEVIATFNAEKNGIDVFISYSKCSDAPHPEGALVIEVTPVIVSGIRSET